MAVNARTLFEALTATAAEVAQYVAPAATRTIIDKFTGTNISAGIVTLTVKLVAFSTVPGASNVIVVKALAPGETYTFPELVGHVLNTGDFISTIASAGGAINIRGSGREVT